MCTESLILGPPLLHSSRLTQVRDRGVSVSKTSTSVQNRILSLDGLRGVAAVAVVLFHLFLMSPELSAIRELRSMPQEFTPVSYTHLTLPTK
jgi:uncharacterized membrane protein